MRDPFASNSTSSGVQLQATMSLCYSTQPSLGWSQMAQSQLVEGYTQAAASESHELLCTTKCPMTCAGLLCHRRHVT
jgi:hypothetical protein